MPIHAQANSSPSLPPLWPISIRKQAQSFSLTTVTTGRKLEAANSETTAHLNIPGEFIVVFSDTHCLRVAL